MSVAKDDTDGKLAESGRSISDTTTTSRPNVNVRINSEQEDDDEKHHKGSSPTLPTGDHEAGKAVNGEKSNNLPSAFRAFAGKIRSGISPHFHWVSQNNSRSKWKPVIRCALAAWISGIIFIIPTSEKTLGQVCVLVYSIQWTLAD